MSAFLIYIFVIHKGVSAVVQNFGFIDNNNMPSESCNYGDLPLEDINWAVTKSYNDIARNHCGAAFVTNLALYFSSQGFTNLLIDNDINKTFTAIHKIVGNGPVAVISYKARKYFSNRGYSLRYRKTCSFKSIQAAISNNRPLGILLTNNIASWHWVMAIGWKQYDSSGKYLRIVDGWNNTSDKYYKINSSSILWSSTEYWIWDKE